MFKIVALILAVIAGGLSDEIATTRSSPKRFDTIEACQAYVDSAQFDHVDVPQIQESVIAEADNDFEDEDDFGIVPVCAPADQPAKDVRVPRVDN